MYISHEIGEVGERLACKYLEENDYNILQKNFRCYQGEIDIIARDNIKNELVFIEVKTRTNREYGNPADSIDKYKKKHIYKALKYYIFINNLVNEYIRIDAIEVYILKNQNKINHIKQIFWFVYTRKNELKDLYLYKSKAHF